MVFRVFSESIRVASLAAWAHRAASFVRGNEEVYGTTGTGHFPRQRQLPLQTWVSRGKGKAEALVRGAAAVSDNATDRFCCTLMYACVLCHSTVLARMSRSVASLVRGNVKSMRRVIGQKG